MGDEAPPAMSRTTLRGHPVVQAPGKVLLIGEYAVLEGGPAVVAAINRRAVGQFMDALDPESPLIAEAVGVTIAALGDRGAALPPGSVLVDSAELSSDGKKLGLGSSAATAVAAVGAMLEFAGVPLASNGDLLFSLADTAHRRAQGGIGSGADVAAATHGGLLSYMRPGGGVPVIRKLGPLTAVELVVFSTGEPSSTVDRLRAVNDLGQRAPEQHRWLIAELRRAAETFIESMILNDARGIIAATRSAAQVMSALGRAAEVAISTPTLSKLEKLAEELGGAAKPSGAGGGDVGVAFLPDRTAAAAFSVRAPALGVQVLDLAIDHEGAVRR
jgi:phosphomevalonate kinase